MKCWIRTVSGRRVSLQYPEPETISLEDIVHGLSRAPRFAGHTPVPYNVLTHSWNVSLLMPSARLSMLALLHDASEAYTGDVSTPLKRLLPDFAAIESGLMAAIYAALGVRPPHPEEVAAVHEADQRVLAWEVQTILGENPADGWTDREPGVAPLTFTHCDPVKFLLAFNTVRQIVRMGGAT